MATNLGMQMPGGGKRDPQLNVYTGLLFLAVVALATASVLLFLAGGKLGPDGDAFGVQDAKSIKLSK
jgi:hypothetical protein